MNFDFACSYEKEEEEGGERLIRCRDMPELLSWPAEGETFEQWARYAVEDCIVFRMQDGELVPEASAARPGEYVVRLSLSAEPLS